LAFRARTAPLPAPRELIDGRRVRSEASRDKIVRAMLQLVTAGDIMPCAEAVATRAGVGLRTVFRHFENMEGLYQQMNRLMAAEILPVVERPFVSSDWRGRILEMIDRRVGVFERIMPLKIAADVQRHRSPFLAAQGVELVRQQRAVLEAVLPGEVLADAALVEGLDLLLSFEAWRRLRKDQNLPRARAKALLERAVGALIEAPAS
jgi:AcrR family transcriptional regulator